MVVSCFFQSVRVPRSSHHQRPVWSVRCCLLAGAVEVRTTTPPIWTQTKSYVALAALTNTGRLCVSYRSDAKKTKVKRKTNNPQFEEVFYFEVNVTIMCLCWSERHFFVVVGHQLKSAVWLADPVGHMKSPGTFNSSVCVNRKPCPQIHGYFLKKQQHFSHPLA